jgi:urease accessory protein
MTLYVELAAGEECDQHFRERALLQTWFSPSFPAGSFAYSQGLEKAVEAGFVNKEAALLDWVTSLFEAGCLFNDLCFATLAWKATQSHDWGELASIAEFAAALQPGSERYFETVNQGASFLQTIGAAWPCAILSEALDSKCLQTVIPYPVAAALAASAHGLSLIPTLEALAVAFAANQTSAAIRLGVIGQTGAQRILAALLPVLREAVMHASIATLDEIGGACFSADLCGLEHETQHTRLFLT